MNRRHECMLLICLITHSVLPTGQAITKGELKEHKEKSLAEEQPGTPDNAALTKEDSLTRTQKKIMEAHPNFFASLADYYEPIPQTDPPKQPTILPDKDWESMRSDCDYYGILHFQDDISLAPMPLKIPVYIDEEVSDEYKCDFSEAAKKLLRHKKVSWFKFKKLYAYTPGRARTYLNGFRIDITGPLFPEKIPSSRKRTSRADSLASTSSGFLNDVMSKIIKSPGRRVQNTFSGSNTSDMKNRMSRSSTWKSMTNLVKAANPSKWSLLRNRRAGLAQTLKKANQNQKGTP